MAGQAVAMTRLLLCTPLLGLLAACDTAPAIGGDASAQPPDTGGPVAVPMDPGQITCTQINGNPGYLSEAVNWIEGHWRATLLSGSLPGPVPDRATLSSNVAAYCSASTNATARAAYSALTAG